MFNTHRLSSLCGVHFQNNAVLPKFRYSSSNLLLASSSLPGPCRHASSLQVSASSPASSPAVRSSSALIGACISLSLCLQPLAVSAVFGHQQERSTETDCQQKAARAGAKHDRPCISFDLPSRCSWMYASLMSSAPEILLRRATSPSKRLKLRCSSRRSNSKNGTASLSPRKRMRLVSSSDSLHALTALLSARCSCVLSLG